MFPTMEMITKNIGKGEPISNLAELKRLALEGKSVIVETAWHKYVRPAGFMINWPLTHLLNLKFFYSIKLK